VPETGVTKSTLNKQLTKTKHLQTKHLLFNKRIMREFLLFNNIKLQPKSDV